MSLSLMSQVWETDLKSGPRFVLMCLADHADEKGYCWPAIDRIAERTGISRSSVCEHISTLKKRGFISQKSGGGRRRSSEYILTIQDAKKTHDAPLETVQNSDGLDAETVQNSDGLEIVNSPESGLNSPEFGLNSPESGHKPSRTTNEPPEIYITGEIVEPFDEFWEAYPRKVAKGAARKAYEKATNSKKVTDGEILDGAKKFAETRFGEDPRYTAHPATWLNAERWADDFDSPINQPLKGTAGNAHRQPGHGLSQSSFGPCTGEQKLQIIAGIAARRREERERVNGCG